MLNVLAFAALTDAAQVEWNGDTELLRLAWNTRDADEEGLDRIQQILEEGLEPVDVERVRRADPNHIGYTPLLAAAHEGHRAVARILLDNGAKVDHRDQQHRETALVAAVRKKKVNTACLLITQKVTTPAATVKSQYL